MLQDSLDVHAAWCVDDDGRLDMTRLLTAFGTFFGEHSGHWLERFSEYPEAGPQLILQAYLNRVVNGGGRIEREYGLARGRLPCGGAQKSWAVVRVSKLVPRKRRMPSAAGASCRSR